MFCVICGTENEPKMKFCKNCGSPLKVKQLPPSYQQAPKPQNPELIKPAPIPQPMPDGQSENGSAAPAGKKRTGLVIGLVSAAAVLLTALGVTAWMFLAGPFSRDSQKDGIDKKAKDDRNTQQDISKASEDPAQSKMDPMEARAALRRFIVESLEKVESGREFAAYQFKEQAGLPEDSVCRSGDGGIDAYQLVDINFDGIDELLLRYCPAVENYTLICSVEEDGEVKVHKEVPADNQNFSPLEYASAAASYYDKNTGRSTTFISGASGSGAGNHCFIYEVKRDLTISERFSYYHGVGEEPDRDYKVNGSQVSEEEYFKAFEEFQETYKQMERYDYMPIYKDLEEEFSIYAGLEVEREVSDAEVETAYQEYLAGGYGHLPKVRYSYLYLDNDNVKELLVVEDDVYISICTYINGEVRQAGRYASNGHFRYAPFKGFFEVYYADEQEGLKAETTSYYYIYKDIASEVCRFRKAEDPSGNGTFLYERDGEGISQWEYEKQMESMVGDYEMYNEYYASLPQIGEEESVVSEPPEEEMESGDAYPMLGGYAEASSVLDGQAGNTYEAGNVLDNNPDTTWAEGASGDGTGEWLCIYFSSKQRIDYVSILNGYGKSQELYQKNSRLKKATLKFSDGSSQQIVLEDNDLSMQEKKIIPVETEYVWIQVDEVYEGSTYKDLCISEVLCY